MSEKSFQIKAIPILEISKLADLEANILSKVRKLANFLGDNRVHDKLRSHAFVRWTSVEKYCSVKLFSKLAKS